MDAFQLFSVVGITITAVLGIYNLAITLSNQRKHHRELIFQKQLDFFMELQLQINKLQNAVSDINSKYCELNKTQVAIFDLTNLIDDTLENNELILPDKLYKELHKFMMYCSDVCNLAHTDPMAIDKLKIREFIDREVEVMMAVREFLGIERLSAENVSLLKAQMNRTIGTE